MGRYNHDLVQGARGQLYQLPERIVQRVHFPLHYETETTENNGSIECHR